METTSPMRLRGSPWARRGQSGRAHRKGRGQNSATSPAPGVPHPLSEIPSASAMQALGCPPAGAPRRAERDWPDPRHRVTGKRPSLELSCRREVRRGLKGLGQALRVEIARRVRSAAQVGLRMKCGCLGSVGGRNDPRGNRNSN